jgi:hypothetical protein
MGFTVRLRDAFDAEFGQLPEAVQDEMLALMALRANTGRGWVGRTPTR